MVGYKFEEVVGYIFLGGYFMKKMFIVLTSALLVGSGLYSMEKTVEIPAPATQEAEYGQAIVRYSTWDRTTGLLTLKDSEAAQGQVYTKSGDNWFVGDARNVAAAAPAEENVVELLNRIVAAKEQTAPMEVVAQEPAQPENTVALKLNEKGKVILNQMVRIKDGIFTVVAIKGGIVFGTVRELGSDVIHAAQANPYRTAGHVAEGLYLVGAIVAIPATAGLSYVAGAATPLVTDLAFRHGRQVYGHASNAGRTMIKKAGKIKKENCSIQ